MSVSVTPGLPPTSLTRGCQCDSKRLQGISPNFDDGESRGRKQRLERNPENLNLQIWSQRLSKPT